MAFRRIKNDYGAIPKFYTLTSDTAKIDKFEEENVIEDDYQEEV